MDLPILHARPADSHKGTFGTVLIIGGSRGMAGAASLAGSAALRSGCGLVRIAVPEVCLETVASYDRCYTTIPLPCDSDGRLSFDALPILLDHCNRVSAVGLGPGLGVSDPLVELVQQLNQKNPQPMVIDADGLNLLSLGGVDQLGSPYIRVLTPHPGEFARLSEAVARQNRDQQILLARQMAEKFKNVLVLKGHRTLITDGREKFINTTGNSGMSTGGSGDVLTGIITSFLAQGYSGLDAARLGVYIHGLAGDLAVKEVGEISMTADNIIEFLPQAFTDLITTSGAGSI